MTHEKQNFVSSAPELSGAVIQAGAASNERLMADFLYDDGPSAEEWRRGMAMIAEQLLLRMAGYTDREEFAKDGCRFVWDRFQSLGEAATRRGH
jgi:hypothetical protein